jgi:hypothetical protein
VDVIANSSRLIDAFDYIEEWVYPKVVSDLPDKFQTLPSSLTPTSL